MATAIQEKTKGNVSGGKKVNNTNMVSPVKNGEFVSSVETIGNLQNFRVPMTLQVDPFNVRDQRTWFEYLASENHNLEFKIAVSEEAEVTGGSLIESWTEEGKPYKKEYLLETDDLFLINKLKQVAVTYVDLRGKGELNKVAGKTTTGNTSSASGNRGRISDAHRAEILEKYSKGSTIEQLAKDYDRSLKAIGDLINNNKEEMKAGNTGLPNE